jgi:hypothetical protein
MLLLVGYFALVPAAAITFLPENISFPRMETNNLLPTVIASLTIPAVLVCARILLGKRAVNVVVVTAVLLWAFIELFHALITPIVAFQFGYQVRQDLEFTLGFRFLVLAAAVLPVFLANQFRWRGPLVCGMLLTTLYLGEAVVGSFLVSGSLQNVLAMIGVISLGGLSGKFGEAAASWIERTSGVV